jgi:hypothetical protein
MKSNELNLDDAKSSEVTVLATRCETLISAAKKHKEQLQKFR